MEARIRAAGFKAVRRNVRYDWLGRAGVRPSMRAVHADAVVTGTAQPIRDGAVVVDGDGEVVDVGAAARSCRGTPGLAVERVRGVVLPGLVNAHTHVELSAYRGQGRRRARVRRVGRPLHRRARRDAGRGGGRGDRAGGRGARRVRHGRRGRRDATRSARCTRSRARGFAGCVFHEVFGVEPRAAR